MKIIPAQNNTYKISFKANQSREFFIENPTKSDFVSKVAINSAIESMKDDKNIAFIPAGSWITQINYDPNLSDHDFTMLMPKGNSYNKMEAEIFDVRENIKKSAIKRLKSHKIDEKTIQEKILPSINIFPTPQVQECFNSYDQFIDLTNLKISIHDTKDVDTGLWKMKGLVRNHLENEGSLLFLKEDGTTQLSRIKDNKDQFLKYLADNNIYIQPESTLYSSDKLNIINEFIQKLQNSSELDTRSFFKYLNRIKKFFFTESVNDLFLISNDPRKNSKEKFQTRILLEQEYQDQFRKITNSLDEVKNLSKDNVPNQFAADTLKELKKFKILAEDVLSWPTLRSFTK